MKITSLELGDHVAVTAEYRAQETVVYRRDGDQFEEVGRSVTAVTDHPFVELWFDHKRRSDSGDA